MTETQTPPFPQECVVKWDSIYFQIKENCRNGLYDRELPNKSKKGSESSNSPPKTVRDSIEEHCYRIQWLLHKNDFSKIQTIYAHDFFELQANLFQGNFAQMLKPYKKMFYDYKIKLQLLPTEELSNSDKDRVSSFYTALIAAYDYYKLDSPHKSFCTLTNLNFSAGTFSSIIFKMMNRDSIRNELYELLLQINNSLTQLKLLLDKIHALENIHSEIGKLHYDLVSYLKNTVHYQMERYQKLNDEYKELERQLQSLESGKKA
ncbi:hypothetical protein TRFO_26410 [Tritrichomonas foetus]|uniref:Uncharacterized protein n=1 Tax=Tritrichomonas foetus TaxID=1144522 RepID=A0A1J4K4B0_9EUKA|nr:hypothetical protein TRFO_26410 [Tritrichomonas foetus]|eukprot:OHT05802.1 hypothetical protein TRFO_26410 [Tritrichomonas foetus]